MIGILKGAAAGLLAVGVGFVLVAALLEAPAPEAGAPPPARIAAQIAETGAEPAGALVLPEPRPVPVAGPGEAAQATPAARLAAAGNAGGTTGQSPAALAEPGPAPLGPPGVGNRPPTVAAAAEPAPGDAAVLPPVPDPAPAGQPAPAAPVVTGRLPQIGAPAAEAAAPPAPAAEVVVGRLPQIGAPRPQSAPPADPAAATAPAWVRFRAAAGASDLPPLGIVLRDPGGEGAAAGLAELPFAVSLALDPFDPAAPARAAAYRAAGHEVLLDLGGIAAGVTAADLEVMLSVWAEAFPEALGLIELPPTDARRARALAPVLIPALAARGLALVAPDRGLSPLLSAARARGVPALGLWRALDAAEEDAAAIRRRLDRAAFEAERTGRAAVWARADRAETLEALAGWVGTGRSARVAIGAAGAALAPP